MKKTVAVIGLGAFGTAICEELKSLNIYVVALDKDEASVKMIADIVDQSAVGDSTNEAVLLELGVKDMDNIILSIGNIESSIMTAAILQELGCKNVTAMVANQFHEKILQKIGVKNTIFPEVSAGVRVARRIANNNVLDYYDVDTEYGIYEVKVGPNFQDKPLSELNIRNIFDINIVLIRRNKDVIIPKAHDSLVHDDVVMVVAKHKIINKFQNYLNGK